MGTRSTTVVMDGRRPVVSMYRQFDGYPEGHGQELVDFFQGKQVINGIRMGEDLDQYFNGMGCLAAAMVAFFKEEIGGFYLMPCTAKKPHGDYGQEYFYDIYCKDDDETDRGMAIYIRITTAYSDKVLYDGPVDEFNVNLITEEED